MGQKVKIAVKIIDRTKAPSDFLMKFLPRELEIYTKLHHLNIIKVYEIIDTCNKVYIFMELAEGGDLLDFIKVFLNNLRRFNVTSIILTNFRKEAL